MKKPLAPACNCAVPPRVASALIARETNREVISKTTWPFKKPALMVPRG